MVLPSSPVPRNKTRFVRVIASLPSKPVSGEMLLMAGRAGATLSMVTTNSRDKALALPAKSYALAAKR